MAKSRKRKMKGQKQKMSPIKYIKTKARSLPIWKCFITETWREEDLASIIVIREHTNGNITYGGYLVDLACKGVKDSYFNTNVPREEILESIDEYGFFIECEYKLVHNIIFEGIEYAENYGFTPHKDFAVSKYILEEDDDSIELIDIKTGGEDGRPHLIEQDPKQAKKDIEILKRTAGEGNFDITIGDGFDDEELEGFDDFDEELEDDFDEDFYDDDEGDGYGMFNLDIFKNIASLIEEDEEFGELLDESSAGILKFAMMELIINVAYMKVSGRNNPVEFEEILENYDFDKIVEKEEEIVSEEMEELIIDLEELNTDYLEKYVTKGKRNERKLFLLTQEAIEILEKGSGFVEYLKVLTLLSHSSDNIHVRNIANEFLDKYPKHPAAILFALFGEEDEKIVDELFERLNGYKYISISSIDAAYMVLAYATIYLFKNNIFKTEAYLHVLGKIQGIFEISDEIIVVQSYVMSILREKKMLIIEDYKKNLTPKEADYFDESVFDDSIELLKRLKEIEGLD